MGPFGSFFFSFFLGCLVMFFNYCPFITFILKSNCHIEIKWRCLHLKFQEQQVVTLKKVWDFSFKERLHKMLSAYQGNALTSRSCVISNPAQKCLLSQCRCDSRILWPPHPGSRFKYQEFHGKTPLPDRLSQITEDHFQKYPGQTESGN